MHFQGHFNLEKEKSVDDDTEAVFAACHLLLQTFVYVLMFMPALPGGAVCVHFTDGNTEI